jgi:DNA-binding NtrC family response regulator
MKTILFVDDDPVFRLLCKRIFEDEGYRVVLAQDGRETLDVVAAENPDVAILDIRMPLQSGFDVAEDIRDLNPHLPIIFYTNHDDICTLDQRSQYAAACVAKSSDFTELLIAVNRVLTSEAQGDTFRFGLPRSTTTV